MKTKFKTYLCVADVSTKHRSDHPSDTRSADGIQRGWLIFAKEPYEPVHFWFIGTDGWMWGRGCKIQLLKRANRQLMEDPEARAELKSFDVWKRDAVSVGFWAESRKLFPQSGTIKLSHNVRVLA